MRDKNVQSALEIVVSELQAQEDLIETYRNSIERAEHEIISLEETIESRDLRILMLEGKIQALEQALTEIHLTSKE